LTACARTITQDRRSGNEKCPPNNAWWAFTASSGLLAQPGAAVSSFFFLGWR
jgi:hypothetical protein